MTGAVRHLARKNRDVAALQHRIVMNYRRFCRCQLKIDTSRELGVRRFFTNEKAWLTGLIRRDLSTTTNTVGRARRRAEKHWEDLYGRYREVRRYWLDVSRGIRDPILWTENVGALPLCDRE